MLLWSCNNTTEKATEKQETETIQNINTMKILETIELNNGEKWMVNRRNEAFCNERRKELVNSFYPE